MLRLLRFTIVLMALSLATPARLAAQGAESPPSVQIVDVDGHAVRVQAIGLAARRQGQPVVVFEAGAMNSLEAWRQVVPAIAAQAPIVAYDRAGLGQSAWDGAPPTPRHVADRMRRLLRQIGVGPPYLLVGHSWGGMLARYHAGYHPEDVAGLVYVDPAPILTEELSANLAPFEEIGAGREGYEAYWSMFESLLARAGPGVRAESEIIRELLDRELAERDLRPAPAVPVVVIVAAEYLPLPFLDQLPFDARAHFAADVRHRTRILQSWALASPDGMLLVSNGTTHAIPREAPELVIWGIERVLGAAAARASDGETPQ